MEFCQLNKNDIRVEDLVIGSVLGDGCISQNGRIQVWHSSVQKDYTLWLMDLFSKHFKVSYQERICKNKYNNKEFSQVGFYVSPTNYTKLIRMIMYTPYKTITIKQLNKLSPLGLAIWYMDDGCLSFIKKDGVIKGRQLILNTQSFSYDEQLLICEYFKKYNIECHIHKDKDKYRIWMNGANASIFLSIIANYIPECMYYKLCYRYHGYKSKLNLCNHQCNNNKNMCL